MIEWAISILAYIFFAAFSAEIFAAIGQANPRTYGDSWTGDNSLDFWSAVFWPVSWLFFAAAFAGRAAARLGRL